MNLASKRVLIFTVLILSTFPAIAQRGCFHSPEAPTDVLLIVGGAGMFFGSSLIGKWRQKRRARAAKASR